jgi:hypothetical protein
MHSAKVVQTTPRAMATLWSFRLEDETDWSTGEVGETGGCVDDKDGVDSNEDGVDRDSDDGDVELVILVVVDAAWEIVNSSD